MSCSDIGFDIRHQDSGPSYAHQSDKLLYCVV